MTVMTQILYNILLGVETKLIKLNSFVKHIFYACLFSNNTSLPIAINHNKYLISLDIFTTVFSWVACNSNKNRT